MIVDVIIVGRGPAGVSAAWPLVTSGVRVHMLEAGTKSVVTRNRACLNVYEHRQQKIRSGRQILGQDLSCLELADGISPKIRATGNAKQ